MGCDDEQLGMSQEAQPFRFNFGGPSAGTDTPARLPQDSHIVSVRQRSGFIIDPISLPWPADNITSTLQGAVPPCTEITLPDHDQDPANEEVSKLIISAERGVILRKVGILIHPCSSG